MPSATTPERQVSEPDLSDLLLVLLTFGAGAVDGISFLGLGRVFTANMTGNLALLGLAVARGSRSDAVRSGVAFIAFVAGVLAASLLANRSPRGDPWPQGVRLVLAVEALTQAAFLVGWIAAAGHPAVTVAAVLTGISGLAMGLQSGGVRALGVAGISTTYVTGTLTGLLSELATGKGSGRDWARRALVVLAMVVGAACAGLLVLDARRVAPALPLAVTLLVLCFALYVLPRTSDRPASDPISGGQP